jgi:hypothetical protein
MKKQLFFVSVVSLAMLSCWKNPIDVSKCTAVEDNGISVAAEGPVQLPGRIEAEAYKSGGEGVGFHDLTSGNTGGTYRTDNVDIQACTDASGGYNVGWIDAGEWLAYDLTVATAGPFTLTMRMASANSGTKTATVTIDGSTVATFNFTDASGWQSWKNLVVTNVNISSGNHELRIVMKTGNFNLNYLDITAQGNQTPVANAGVDQTTNVRSLVTLDGRGSSDPDRGPSSLIYTWAQVTGATVSLTGATTAQPTFTPTATGNYTFRLTVNDGAATSTDDVAIIVSNGTFISLPGRIEAEAYKTGGEGTGFHDLTSGNTGGTYRTDNVDIETCTDASGAYNVGWIDAGEWLAYDVNVTQAGAYILTMRMASANSGTKTATVTVDGSTVATINFTDASGWQSWKNAAVNNVNMTAGYHVVRIAMTTGGFNFNYLDITAQGNQPPVANAGADQTVNVNSPVTFDGRGSSDPDRSPSSLTYNWTQIAGTTITLTGTTTAQPNFTPTATGSYTFRLTVNDGAATSTDDVIITVGNGTYITLPGRIEAEAYKTGGEGTGYHDLTSGNTGASYRTDNVDIERCTDAGLGYNVGWIDVGEWLSYDVNVAQAAVYTLTMRMSSANSGTKTATVTVDGSTVATINFTDASGWLNWKNVSVGYVNLTAGNHNLRIVMTTGGFNLNYLDINLQGANQPPVANAGPDQSGSINTRITLDSRSSSDPDNGPIPLTYSWTQTTGTTVSLTGATTVQPYFTPTGTGSYTFRLTVSDGTTTSSDQVVITVLANTRSAHGAAPVFNDASGKGFSNCKFNYGMDYAGDSYAYPASVTYVRTWLGYSGDNLDNNSNNMLRSCKNGTLAGRTPFVVGYIIAYMGHDQDLPDCDVAQRTGATKSLCTDGTQMIRNNKQVIINRYRSLASQIAATWGTSTPILWMTEPDYLQYTGNTQVGGGFSYQEAGQYLREFLTAVRSVLPNAVFALDVAPWMGGNASAWFAAMPMDMVNYLTVFGVPTEHIQNNQWSNTWLELSSLSNRAIISEGWEYNSSAGDWHAAQTKNNLMSWGVMSESFRSPGSDWESKIQSSLSAMNMNLLVTCPR